MNLLSLERISKSYADKVLLDEVSFGLAQGQKVALIGINGSGKSTFLKIVAGVEAPDTGRRSVRKGTRIAYLPQEPQLDPDKTVAETVFSADQPVLRLIQEYETLLARHSTKAPDLERMEQLVNQIEALNAWDFEVRIHQILGKLQVDFLDQRIGTLSGGQQKRVALAQALVEAPEIMILDEPTNHLDLDSIEWLEKFLSTSKQTLLLVTHDRYFLDSITDEIVELERTRLYSYQGDYATFLEQKAEREQLISKDIEKARSLFRRELDWLQRSPKARGTKSRSRIEAAHALESRTRDTRRNQNIDLQVKGRRIGGKVLEIKKLRKRFGDQTIVDDFTYTFNRRDRIGIIGPNGVGKTTFLELITGIIPPDSGKVRKGETIVFGYYRQEGWHFKDNQRVIEVVTEAAETVEMSKSQTLSASQLLEHFLFPRSMHHQFVETLSGGERRRLHLLRILMTNPNFLILDEPTNDLDLMTMRKLEEFLLDFDGCLLVVSHDRYFMDRLVDHTFVFEGEGKIRDFPGSYSQYREWLDQQTREATAETEKKEPPKEKPKPARARKLTFNEQREWNSLGEEIEKLEARKREIAAQLEGGETDYEVLTQLTTELETLNTELEQKMDRWLELGEIAEG